MEKPGEDVVGSQTYNAEVQGEAVTGIAHLGIGNIGWELKTQS